MFSGYSGPQRQNDDGTFSYTCQSCGSPVGSAKDNAWWFQCEICRRVENNEPLSPEMIALYRNGSTGDPGNVHMVVLERDSSPPNFTLSGLFGRVSRALGLGKPDRPDSSESIAVAQERRRGRLFDNVDFQSITDLDEKLRKGELS